MKLKLLLFGFLFSAIVVNAQFTVSDENGQPIVDGDVIAVNSNDPSIATKDFFVTNTGTETIFSSIKYVSTDTPSPFQVCYGGQCYDNIVVGNSYPPVSAPQVIEPGASTGQGNHFLYTGPEVTSPVNHVFRFYQVDASGNEIGEDLTITYLYDPTLGLGDNEISIFDLTSTVVNDELLFNLTDDVDITIYDMRGRVIKSKKKLTKGTKREPVGDLLPQLYIVKVTNDRGVSQSVRFVKR
ncbi:MAG: T9SS type A sorting domain-containing protein [Patiriisocius sp.]|uniref:T9SS type A sorting domain-containing protein n=1 Tax=Patiriisocius sp. TaxID=2822396 RepID=UPI003EF57B12